MGKSKEDIVLEIVRLNPDNDFTCLERLNMPESCSYIPHHDGKQIVVLYHRGRLFRVRITAAELIKASKR